MSRSPSRMPLSPLSLPCRAAPPAPARALLGALGLLRPTAGE